MNLFSSILMKAALSRHIHVVISGPYNYSNPVPVLLHSPNTHSEAGKETQKPNETFNSKNGHIVDSQSLKGL